MDNILNINLNDSIFGSIEVVEQQTGKVTQYPMNSALQNFGVALRKTIISNAAITGIEFTNNSGSTITTNLGLPNPATVQLNHGVMIGTGNSPKSVAMVAMQTPVTSLQVSSLQQPILYNEVSDGIELTWIKRFTNITADNINISQVALSYYTAATTYIMYIYDYFASPFVMQPSKSYFFKIKIKFNLNFSKPTVAKIAKMCGVQTSSLTTTNVLSTNPSTPYSSIVSTLGSGTNGTGIRVGSSFTANTINSYYLVSPILSTVLNDGGSYTKVNTPFVDSGVLLTRTLTNISGSPVDIWQVALITQGQSSAGNTIYSMTYRIVLSSKITVNPGQQVDLSLLFKPNF